MNRRAFLKSGVAAIGCVFLSDVQAAPDVLQPWVLPGTDAQRGIDGYALRPSPGTIIKCEAGHHFATIKDGTQWLGWPVVETVHGEDIYGVVPPIRCKCGAVAIRYPHSMGSSK